MRHLQLLLTSLPVLALPRTNGHLTIFTKTCNKQLWWVLVQKQQDGYTWPIRYRARTLAELEKKLAIKHIECLAVVWTIFLLHSCLEGGLSPSERTTRYLDGYPQWQKLQENLPVGKCTSYSSASIFSTVHTWIIKPRTRFYALRLMEATETQWKMRSHWWRYSTRNASRMRTWRTTPTKETLKINGR